MKTEQFQGFAIFSGPMKFNQQEFHGNFMTQRNTMNFKISVFMALKIFSWVFHMQDFREIVMAVRSIVVFSPQSFQLRTPHCSHFPHTTPRSIHQTSNKFRSRALLARLDWM